MCFSISIFSWRLNPKYYRVKHKEMTNFLNQSFFLRIHHVMMLITLGSLGVNDLLRVKVKQLCFVLDLSNKMALPEEVSHTKLWCQMTSNFARRLFKFLNFRHKLHIQVITKHCHHKLTRDLGQPMGSPISLPLVLIIMSSILVYLILCTFGYSFHTKLMVLAC